MTTSSEAGTTAPARSRGRVLDVVLIVFVLAVVGAVAVIALTGDRNTFLPDAQAVEDRLVGELGDSEVVAAECPEVALNDIGDAVTCAVTLADGTERRARLEIINDEGWTATTLLDY
jgi:hypothetical protein